MIEELIDALDEKLDGVGPDEEKLSPAELAIMRAYSFADMIDNEDFYAFVTQSDPKEWQETLSALETVGAREYAGLMDDFIRKDGAAMQNPDFSPQHDYDEAFAAIRDRYQSEDGYIADTLTAFARKNGLI